MLPRLASSLSLLALVFTFREIESKSGDYFKYYNKSSFSYYSNDGCTLYATYDSGGSRPYYGCKEETKRYESQLEFDLEYYELLKVCPYLAYVPPSYRGEPDYSSKNSLPSELVWSSSPCTDSYYWCPRWQCDNSSSLWDPDYNKSYSYHEITTLSFSSSPLESKCWQCECQDMTNSAASGKNSAWYCGSSPRYTFDPINEPFRYIQKDCSKETDSPTPQPTVSPVPEPTPQPTPYPVTTYCSNAWGNDFIWPGSYFWDTTVSGDCGTIKLCYCQVNGDSYCQSSWADIMDDDLLYPEFLNRCTSRYSWNKDENYLADCWRNTPDSVSRLFSWYADYSENPTSNCYLTDDTLCPRCGCSDDPFTQTSLTNHSYKTSVFDQIQNDSLSRAFYTYEYKCTTCNCSYVISNAISAPRGPLSYVDPETCDHYDESNNNDVDLTEDCIDEPLQCYSNSGPYDPDNGVDSCSGQRESINQFENACKFERVRYDDSHPEDVCVEDGRETIGSWGCADSFECELYGGDGCYKASFDFQVTQYDCINDKWLGDQYSVDLQYSCCSEDHFCNNRTVEEYLDEDCSKNSYLKEYKSYSRECAFSQRNLYEITDNTNILRAAYCGDSLEYNDFLVGSDETEDEETLCELLYVYWQYNTFCDCNERKLRIEAYTEAGIKDADVMQKYIRKGFWSSTNKAYRSNLETMYEFWNCADYNEDDDGADDKYSFFKCDWDSDVAAIENVRVKNAASRFAPIWLLSLLLLLFIPFDNKFTFLFVSIASIYYVSALGDLTWQRNGGYYEDCEFYGEVDSGTNYVCEYVTHAELQHQNEDLTWDVLVEACPELEHAGCYTKDARLKQSELVWPNADNACNSCPRCPCSNATDTIRHFVDNSYDLDSLGSFITQKCHTCSCSEWSSAKEYAWDCSSGSTQYRPYSVNDTEFCPDTPRPTPAPTEPSLLKCVGGNIGSTYTTSDSIYGSSGSSHCAASNITVSRYDDGEPHVCLFDEVEDLLPPNTFWMSSNSEPFCLALGAKEDACYWSEGDVTLDAFDCALNEWVSDKYHIEATMLCCNDGDYCNNVTTVDHRQDYFEYENFQNETKQVKCKKSEKLKEMFNRVLLCPYKDPGFDKEYVRKVKCKSGKTNKFGCDQLREYWNYQTRCSCSKSRWFLANVNATYDEILNENFDGTWEYTREQLEKWNKTLGCDWAPGSRWYCSKAPVATAFLALLLSVVSAIF